MSVAAGAAGSGDGNGGGDDERKKGMLEISDSNSWEVSSVEESGEEVESKRFDLSNYEAERRLEILRITKSIDAHLPLKRSLSTHYQGKSKSFGNLAELGTEEAKDLEKKEHPLNKRRRLQIANEIRDKELSGEASCNIIRASLPHEIPKYEDDDDKKASDHDQDEDDDKKKAPSCNIIRASLPHEIPNYEDDDDKKASDHDQDEDDDDKKSSDHDEDDEN